MEGLSEETNQDRPSVEDNQSDSEDIDLLPPPLKI